MDRAGNYSLQNIKSSSGGSIRKSLNKIIRNKKHSNSNANNRLSLPSCNDVIKYDLPSPGALERAGSMTSLYIEREVDLKLIKESEVVHHNDNVLRREEDHFLFNKTVSNKTISEVNALDSTSTSDCINNTVVTNNKGCNNVEDNIKDEDVFTPLNSVPLIYASPTNSPNTQRKLARAYAVKGLSKNSIINKSKLSRERSQPVIRRKNNKRQISNSEGTLTSRAINGRSGKRGSSDNIVSCSETVTPELNSLLESHSMNIQEQNTSILNFEDDELIEEGIADHGPYNELEVLKKKPAHFAVFINYVLSEVDKSGLLLMLTVDTYKNLSSTKDLLKKASEIYKNFFSVESIFKVDVDGAIGESINKLLISKNPSEEALKFMFDPSVQICTDVIRQQLSNFRSVREKGLAHMYGDTYLPLHKLDTIMRAVDEITNKKLNSLLIEKDNAFKMLKAAPENGKSPEAIKIQIERISLMQDVIKTYAEINGYKKKKTVDRIQSIFTRGPKPKVTDKQRKPTGASNSQELTSDDKKKKFFSNTRSERKPYKNKQNRHQLRQMSEKIKSSQQHQVEPRSKSAIFTAKLHLSNEKEENCSMMNDSHMVNCDVLITSSDELDTAAVIRHEVASDCTEISDSVCDALTSSSSSFLSPDKIQSSTSATDIQSLTQVDQSYSNAALESNRKLNRGGSFRGRGEGKSLRGKTGHSKSDPDPDSVKKAVLYSTSLVSETDGACISISQNIIPTLDGDPDYELPDPLPWHQRVNKNLLKKLSKQEVNKQSNINELIDTEMQHFANLVMINKLFYEPLQRSKIVNEIELYDLFSTLPELVHFHKLLSHNFQAVKKRDGNIVNGVAVPMLDLFEDDIGENFKKQAAKFCANQKKSLRTITKLKTDNKKFSDFLEQTHRKNFVTLGRLQLQDWIPAQFQRLTKYPLMIKGIIKCYKTSSDQNSEEYKNLLKLKEITTKNLLYTDDFIRKTDNRYDLEKIQQNLDRSPLITNKNVNIDGSLIHTYKDIDLLEEDSIYQGYLKYVIGIKKQDAYDVFVVVYKHLIVLIETNANKQHFLNVLPQKTISQGVGIPFITMSDAVIRRTATDKRAFFMLANNNMYQMLASTQKSRNEWVDVLNKAVTEAQKDKPSSETPQLKIRPSEFHNNPDDMNLTVEDSVVQSDELKGRLHPIVDPIEENIINEPTVVHPTSHHIQKENQIRNDMNNLLQEKRKLIAEMANSDLENLDTVFEISQNDSDVDNKTILLDMILNVDKLDSLMNNSATADNIYTFPASNSNIQPTNSNLTSRKSSGIPPEDYTNDDRWATPINLDIPKTLPSVVNPPLTTQHTEDVDQSLYERLTTKNKERKAFTSIVEVEKVWSIITTLKSQLHVLLEREMHPNTRNQDDSNENADVDIEKSSPPPTYEEVRQEHSEEEGICNLSS